MPTQALLPAVESAASFADGLPLLPVKSLRQLQRNGWITVRAEGADFRVGVGPRVKSLGARWEIALPEGD